MYYILILSIKIIFKNQRDVIIIMDMSVLTNETDIEQNRYIHNYYNIILVLVTVFVKYLTIKCFIPIAVYSFYKFNC